MELSKVNTIDAIQFEQIKNHLSMVFKHEIDPSFGNKEHVGLLTQVHRGLGDVQINC